MIEEYIKNQLQEDIAADQISLKEYMDPFTGAKNTKAQAALAAACRKNAIGRPFDAS